jgi:hypothetical protein
VKHKERNKAESGSPDSRHEISKQGMPFPRMCNTNAAAENIPDCEKDIYPKNLDDLAGEGMLSGWENEFPVVQNFM